MDQSVTQSPRAKVATIKDTLQGNQFREAVAKALPTHLTPDRFIRVALTAMTRTPKLAQCDQASFFSALLLLSQYGLEPDGRRAHLIPFENRKRGVTECQLIVDYKGLVELAMRSGSVSNIHADVVCGNDSFDFDRGELKQHKIDFRRPRGEVFAAYALCRFKDGSEKCEVMTKDEIEAIRKRSRAGQSGPWVTDWNEMAKKTVFRRLSKWLPLSPEFRDAVESDDDVTTVDTSHAAEASRAMITDNPAFALPVHEDDGAAPDDTAAEAEAGLAPAEKEQTPETTQSQLAALVVSSGFTFTDFQRWAEDSGNLPDASSLASFDDVPTDASKRFLRAKVGLLKGLEAAKGAAV